jgi:hypothetical protein
VTLAAPLNKSLGAASGKFAAPAAEPAAGRRATIDTRLDAHNLSH